MRISIALTISLVLMAAPVAAQSKYDSDTGSRVRIPKRAELPNKKLSKDDTAQFALNEFARCIVDRSASKVSQALLLAPGEDGAAFRQASTDECLGGQVARLSFAPSLLRGAVFGELYRRQQKGLKGIADKFPVQPFDWTVALPPSASQPFRTHYFMMTVSDCLDKSDRESMRAIVINPIGSPERSAGFAKLIATLGPCVPEGETLTFSRSTLEGAFGEFLYRSLVPGKALNSEKGS